MQVRSAEVRWKERRRRRFKNTNMMVKSRSMARGRNIGLKYTPTNPHTHIYLNSAM
jgi:hypothetical protein